jgi:pyruvate/2-oxoglutarate dehydrogenase complex dihydrolipoamide dehydrogenase (E3) component
MTRGDQVTAEQPNPAPPAANGHGYPVKVQPMDQYNRALLDNARPIGWRNPTPPGRYNLIAIGSGTAGLVSTIGGAGLGARVALIEKHLMGGDCLNTGCVPSKSIIRSARAIGEIRRAQHLGIDVAGAVTADFGAVMARMREIRAGISHDDSVQRVTGAGVDLYFGAARFTGPDTVEVDHDGERVTLHFAKAVITTGSKPRRLDVSGAEETGYLTNETLFELTEPPRRLAVIGGGPIGAEMAQTFARLGSMVTLIENKGQLLSREDADAAQIVQQAFVDDGVELIFNATVKALKRTATGKVVEFEREGQRAQVEVDEVLVSIGRAPTVEGLGLEAAGVVYSDQGVTVDDTLRTSNPNIYAAGDVASRYQFTHIADATARIVLQNALFPGPKRKASDLIVPWATFTDPEVAHVGMYAHEAEAKGIQVETFTQPLSHVDRARADGETDGFVKLHVKAGSDKILGATIVAAHAGDMISEITTAMAGGVGLAKLVNVIHPYPTQAEAIWKAANQYNRSRLKPWLKRVLEVWMRWRR